jgi:hypothetical protein
MQRAQRLTQRRFRRFKPIVDARRRRAYVL